MNTTIYGMSIVARVKKIWVCWDDQYIADSYEDVVDYSRNSGMISDFGDWLRYHCDYDIEDIFEMTEDEKARVADEYDEYVKSEIANQWEEKEITI